MRLNCSYANTDEEQVQMLQALVMLLHTHARKVGRVHTSSCLSRPACSWIHLELRHLHFYSLQADSMYSCLSSYIVSLLTGRSQSGILVPVTPADAPRGAAEACF